MSLRPMRGRVGGFRSGAVGLVMGGRGFAHHTPMRKRVWGGCLGLPQSGAFPSASFFPFSNQVQIWREKRREMPEEDIGGRGRALLGVRRRQGLGSAAPDGEGEDDVGRRPDEAVTGSHHRRRDEDGHHPYRAGKTLQICRLSPWPG